MLKVLWCWCRRTGGPSCIRTVAPPRGRTGRRRRSRSGRRMTVVAGGFGRGRSWGLELLCAHLRRRQYDRQTQRAVQHPFLVADHSWVLSCSGFGRVRAGRQVKPSPKGEVSQQFVDGDGPVRRSRRDCCRRASRSRSRPRRGRRTNDGGNRARTKRDAEERRLEEDRTRARDWKRFGPYLSERQWGTVREDYSPDGDAWRYLPHDQARSQAYRWGEDGLLGLCDRQGRLCFALALWNGVDPILKERLFGLTGPEGNHGEDVKELYFYLDATPTHSYGKALYKYPQREFPYVRLCEENRKRGRTEREFEITDAGVFDDGRYFDVTLEHAKAAPGDLCLAITVANRGPADAPLVLLPTLWFANSWSWGREGEGYLRPDDKPSLVAAGPAAIDVAHPSLGKFRFSVEAGGRRRPRAGLHRERDQHRTALRPAERLALLQGRVSRLRRRQARRRRESGAAGDQGGGDLPPERAGRGRAAAAAAAGGGDRRTATRARGRTLAVRRLRGRVDARRAEADAFYARKTCALAPDERLVVRQAYAGLLWTQQFYHYDVRAWLDGDPAMPPPPASRLGRAQRGVAPPLQPRRHLDARQVGVPLVRRLGSGVPHDPLRAHRSELRQGAAHLADARVVHAPERAAPGVRVRLRRREPAGARLGRLARLQDRRRRPTASAIASFWRGCSRSCSSTSPGGSTARTRRGETCSRAGFSGSTTSASSIARSRCGRATSSSRPTARPGWPSSARRCCRWRWSWPRPIRCTRTWPRSSSSTSSTSPTR